MVGFNFAPTGWALCQGQLMPISQNTALFSLLGTQFGGDGQTNFALPDLQGSAPVMADGFQIAIGQSGGVETVTLTPDQIPAHTHSLNSVSAAGSQTEPTGNVWAQGSTGGNATYNAYSSGTPNSVMNPGAVAAAGGGQPHNNLQPYLVATFIIALTGVFPARS
ncbi:MAG: phage tail protein [Candidatus Binataceae bacterium]